MSIDFTNWRKSWFLVGEEIEWIEPCKPGRHKGRITKIKKNHYGRFSYYVGDRLVLLEDIGRARRETK